MVLRAVVLASLSLWIGMASAADTRGICPDREGPIFASGVGPIVGFLPKADAVALRVRTELQLMARIHPHYLDNPRAVISVMGPQGATRVIALVPDGLRVEISDIVQFDGAYWDPDDSCQYIPSLIRTPAPLG